MLDGLFMLLLLSTIMAVASFLAGSLPLSFTLSQSRLKLVATIGMGVLVGTALIVIIPEGVETLYSAGEYTAEPILQSPTSQHSRRHAALSARLNHMPIPQQIQVYERSVKPTVADLTSMPGPVLPNDANIQGDVVDSAPPRTPTEPGKVSILGQEPGIPAKVPKPSLTEPPAEDQVSADPLTKAEAKREPHAWIGLSLVCGFILMYLLDTLPIFAPPSSSRPQSNIYSLSDLSTSPVTTPAPPQRSLSTTLGLCIHAAADGIALGASSSSASTTSLSFIIFIAIMVHKAPAAFGLTSVLLKQGLGKRGARAHLVVFSLAAPVGALATWILVRALGGGAEREPAEMRWWTGVLLLFSGGTFLYVAMHTMQEEDAVSSATTIPDDNLATNGYLEAGASRSSRRGPRDGKDPRLVLAAVGGMLLPLLTQVGHAH